MNVLTFDIEDWFHLLNNPITKSVKNWKSFESRIEYNIEKIFELLNETNTSATFLVLGWIAEKYPHIIKKIDNYGFEIGSHTHTHQLIFEQSRNQFRKDLEKSVHTLENITGKKIKIFRAPSFSITENSYWALETLSDFGIEIDCSVFPGKRANGGINKFKINQPCLIDYKGIKLKEFPMSFKNLPHKVIYSGGGYFRFLPHCLIKSIIASNKYNMAYFHPRDFDYEQPKIKGLSKINFFKSYVGLKSCQSKLTKILNRFHFNDISYYDKEIDWDNVSIFKI